MSKKKTILKAGCGVITLLGMGFVLGFVSLFILIVTIVPLAEGWKSEKSKEFALNQLAKKLQLTEEQRKQIEPVVREFLDRRWELRREYLEETEQLMKKDYLPGIEEFLTEEQKEKLPQVLKHWRREHQDKMTKAEKKPAVKKDPPGAQPQEGGDLDKKEG